MGYKLEPNTALVVCTYIASFLRWVLGLRHAAQKLLKGGYRHQERKAILLSEGEMHNLHG